MTTDERMPRIAPLETNYDLAIMATAVLTLPRPLHAIDAIVVLPGLGEWERLRFAMQTWEAHPNMRHLLVAGHTCTEPEYVKLDVKKLAAFGLHRTEGAVIQVHARHTKEQADWIVPSVKKLGITSLALCVPSYHALRPYLTTLKAFLRHDIQPIPMIPLPVPVSPQTISPQIGTQKWDMMAAELDRIHAYQQKGDVASLDELRSYINWLWNNFPPLVSMAYQAMGR